MTDTEKPASTFETAVADLARQAQLHDFQVIARPRSDGQGAQADLEHNTIDASPDIHTLPENLQQWIAAHEVAHLVLHRPLRLSRKITATLAAGALLIATSFAAGLLAWPTTVGLAIAIAGYVAVVTAFVAALIRTARITRRREDEADDQAASWGYPVTAEVRDHLALYDHRPRSRWYHNHRVPEERRNRHRPPPAPKGTGT